MHPSIASRGNQTAGRLTKRPTISNEGQAPIDHPLDLWLVGVLAISTVTTLLAVGTSFYLYEWRRRLMEVPHLVLPDLHGKHLNEVNAAIRQLSARSMEHGESLKETSEIAMKLQSALDQRDHEITRLRKGYDEQIFRRFLLRFIRIDRFARELVQDQDNSSRELGQIVRLFEDALAECGVENFSPLIGSDSRTVEGIADTPKIIPAQSPDDDHKIAEVLEPGYWIKANGRTDVISPARVSIFLTQG